jgi:hypothetical protein
MTHTLPLVRKGMASEFGKHKPTFFLWFLFLVPLVVSLVTFLMTLREADLSFANPWRYYIALNYRFYLHIYVFLQVLLVSQVNYLEHKNNTWKNLYVLPIPRWVPFVTKLLFAWVLLLLNYAFFYGLVMGSGLLLAQLRPELGFHFQPAQYAYEALVPVLKSFLASFAVAALMYWAGYWLKSMLWLVIVGLAGYASAFALLLYNSRPAYRGLPLAEYHPFNFSGYAFSSFGTGNHALQMEQVYYGLLGGLCIVLSHYWLKPKAY